MCGHVIDRLLSNREELHQCSNLNGVLGGIAAVDGTSKQLFGIRERTEPCWDTERELYASYGQRIVVRDAETCAANKRSCWMDEHLRRINAFSIPPCSLLHNPNLPGEESREVDPLEHRLRPCVEFRPSVKDPTDYSPNFFF